MWFCLGVVVTWSWWRRKWIHAQSEGRGYEIGIGLRIEWVSLKNLNDTCLDRLENSFITINISLADTFLSILVSNKQQIYFSLQKLDAEK